MSTQAPAGASGRKIFSFLVSQSRDESETLLLLSIDTNEELRFALRDVYPELNAATEQRIRALAMRALGYLASELEAGATASLHESGYH